MELTFTQRRRQIRGKWETVGLYSRLPQLEGEDHPVILFYQKGRDALERYVRERLLPMLEDVPEEERRRSRLHRRETRLSYCVSGELIGGQYLSLTLTVEGTDSAEHTRTESHRVWALSEGCLCPIDLFLPRSIAKKYDRWDFILEEARLWVHPKSGGAGEWIEQKHIDKRADL